MLAETLLDAEVRLGDLFKRMPKATPNNNPFHEVSTDAEFVKPKMETIKDLGFSKDQVPRFETLADHTDLVEQVKAEARENDDLPTRTTSRHHCCEQRPPWMPVDCPRLPSLYRQSRRVCVEYIPFDSYMLCRPVSL